MMSPHRTYAKRIWRAGRRVAVGLAVVCLLTGSAAPALAAPISDDFNACSVNTGLWSFINPRGDALVSISGAGTDNARLQIVVPGGEGHDPWKINNAPRLMQPAANTDFQVQVKLENPLTQRFQSQGIIVEQNSNHWLRFDFVSIGSAVRTYAARMVNEVPTVYIDKVLNAGPLPAPIWLRVSRTGNQWTHEHSLDGTSWVINGTFTNTMTVTSVGVYGGNAPSDGQAPGYTAEFDYFFNTASPVVPEDGPLPGGRALTLNTAGTGTGTLTADPDQSLYYCSDVVTLTATPDLGMVFSGWSQDLGGFVNPATIVMSASRQVTATFDVNTTPPIISNVQVEPFPTWARVTWDTNELATSRVDYSADGCTENCGLPFQETVGAWSFEEGAGAHVQDVSGNGRHGTLGGAATREPLGQLGAAISLNGASGHVNLGTMDIPGGATTISMWVKADAFATDPRLISKANSTATQDHYWMVSTFFTGGENRLRFRLKTSGGLTETLIADPGTGLSTGVWTHVAATYDGFNLRLYKNGSLVGTRAHTGQIQQGPAVPAWIGDQPGGGKTFDGLIDEVRIYSRALSATEITTDSEAQLYENFVESSEMVTQHEILLTGLTPSTQYHYRLTSVDLDEMSSSTADDTFTTPAFVAAAFDSDDFNSCQPNPAVWTFVDPVGDSSYSVGGVGTDDARLSISVPAGTSHDPWNTNESARLMQPASNTDFRVEVKLESSVSKGFQQQGIIVEQNSNNWLRFDFVSNGFVHRAIAATVVNGAPQTRVNKVIASGSSPTPMWLRVTRTGDLWTHEYSTNGTAWSLGGTFSHALVVTAVGPFAGNVGINKPAPAHTAIFDYFFETSAPLPEDAERIGGKTLTVNVSGNGAVDPSPARTQYYCGEVVELTANPAPGWVFTGWSQSLSGIHNPESLAVDDDLQVSATFVTDTLAPLINHIEVIPRDNWATVTWVTNEPATSRVDFGVTAAYGRFVADPVPKTVHSLVLTGLTPETLHHFSITAVDEETASASSPDATFTTTDFVPGPFLSDDFNDCDLDTGTWTWTDPVGDASYSFTGAGTDDARITIHVPGGASHDPWILNEAPRLMQPAQDTDFQIVLKMESSIADGNQEHGILVEEDAGRWMRFDFFSNGTQVNAFAALLINGVPTVKVNQLVTAGASPSPMWLRVTRAGDLWSHAYSTDGVNFVTSGQFVQPLAVSAVGFYAGNFGPPGKAPAYTGVFDYFFDTSTPVVPEDGDRAGGRTLTTNVTGAGTVLRNPDRATYHCDEVVELTAIPAPGNAFSQWTGALFGNTNPESLAMVGDQTVNAGFAAAPGPPVIDNVVVTPRDTFATVTWQTNEPATSRVDYGPSTPYADFVATTELVTQHSVLLTGMTAETLYHFSVSSTDSDTLTTSSPDETFATTAPDFRSDDFNVHNLNSDRWTFINPLGDASYSITGVGTDAKLRIHVPGGVSHDPWVTQDAPRLMQPTNDSDFQVQIKLDSTINLGNQEQGIIVEQDSTHWLRFDFVSTSTKINVFAAKVQDGVPQARVIKQIGTGSSQVPMYMRVTRSGDLWTQEYSFDGNTWLLGGSFTEALEVHWIGVFGGNFGFGPNNAPAHTAIFDYFVNTEFPLPSEDGGTVPPDTTSPSIQAVRATSSDTFFRASWKTDEPTTSVLQYGTTTNYGLGQVVGPTLQYDHSFQVGGLTSGTVYHFRITSGDEAGNQTVSGDFQVLVQGVTIEFFYGANQQAGHIGNPQQWADVLGNVFDPDGIATLTYSLNAGPEQPLSIGPDNRRKAFAGDFVVEIDRSQLLSGPNQVRVTATDTIGTVGVETMVLDYTPGNTWPRNYSIDWADAGSIDEVAHVVDGEWQIVTGGVRSIAPEYDRLIAIGDTTWTDYEVTVPVTVHGLDVPGGYELPSGGPGVGFGLRWLGHVDWDGSQPRYGHWPLGAIGWYRWKTTGERLNLLGNENIALKEELTGRTLEIGVPYIFKARVQTHPQTSVSTYFFKIWKQSEFQPSTWDLNIQIGPNDGPASGSLLLLAHHVDATFGSVQVQNLDCSGPARVLSTQVSGNGSVTPDPNLAAYHCEEIVEVRATPNPGSQFTGWSGDKSGSQNPETVVMNADRTVTANFQLAPGAPVISNVHVQVGDTWATITWSTNEPATSRVQYGQTVAYELGVAQRQLLTTQHGITLTGLNANRLHHYRLTSVDSDALSTSTLNAVFTTLPAIPVAFRSDDFNRCTLNTALWTFHDPLGGASYSMAGAGSDNARVRISVPGGPERNPWVNNNAPRLMQASSNTNMQIEVKFTSIPTLRFQSQGIIIQESSNNWLRVDFFSDGTKLNIFASQTLNGVPTPKINQGIAAATELYMRVTRTGNLWSIEHSGDGINWQSPGSFSATLTVTSVGVFGGNALNNGVAPAHTAVVDYFFNTASHLKPEDGGIPGTGFLLDIGTTGDGTIALNPDQQLFYCGETVSLTPVADPGWAFDGWSGDLSGLSSPGTLVMTADRDVVASFAPTTGPPVIFNVQVDPIDRSATLTWRTNEPATTRVDYGVTAGYGSVYEDQALVTHHTAVLTNLTPASLYHFRLTSVDIDLLSTATPNATFTTVPLIYGPVVSDDFNACDLNTGLWTIVDPFGDGEFSVAGAGTSDAHLSITVPGGLSHDAWSSNDAPRLMQPARDEDMQVEVKFVSQVTQQYQEQGIIVEQDSDWWLRFNLHSDGNQVFAFAVAVIDGAPAPKFNVPIGAATPPWVRITRTGTLWTMEYSADGHSWTPAGSFFDGVSVTSVGVFAGNFHPSGNAPAHTAVVDYFFDTFLTVSPEDGGLPGVGRTLTVNTIGSGAVDLDPDQSAYFCNELVTLTAVPDPGDVFSGWSGSLSGIANPGSLVMTADRSVTATFDPDTQPPLIANVQVVAGHDSATVSWVTNEPATSRVDYGETAAYGSFVQNLTLKTSHSRVITGLSPGTQYHYSVTSADIDTMSSSTPDATFTTMTGPPGAFQSDDFNQVALDTQLWTIVNPRNDATFSVSGAGTPNARLSIVVPGGLNHDPWTVNQAPRIMQPATNVDFQIEVKMESAVSLRYQTQGIIIEQDSGRWLRFDVHSNGTHVYGLAASIASGTPSLQILQQIATGTSPVPIWLRVTRSGNQWTHQHSFNGTTWITNGTFSSVLSVTKVGVFGGNVASNGNPPAHTAIFDYVFNTASPIVPEDTP